MLMTVDCTEFIANRLQRRTATVNRI